MMGKEAVALKGRRLKKEEDRCYGGIGKSCSKEERGCGEEEEAVKEGRMMQRRGGM